MFEPSRIVVAMGGAGCDPWEKARARSAGALTNGQVSSTTGLTTPSIRWL